MEELALDPDRRTRLGAAARRLAARFDSAAMATRLEDEIARMLTARTLPA